MVNFRLYESKNNGPQILSDYASISFPHHFVFQQQMEWHVNVFVKRLNFMFRMNVIFSDKTIQLVLYL